jgi:hypothetical protein
MLKKHTVQSVHCVSPVGSIVEKDRVRTDVARPHRWSEWKLAFRTVTSGNAAVTWHATIASPITAKKSIRAMRRLVLKNCAAAE